MNFNEAYELMGRDEAFRATVYAMNTLLLAKGVYSPKEFEGLFIEHAIRYKRKFVGAVAGNESTPSQLQEAGKKSEAA